MWLSLPNDWHEHITATPKKGGGTEGRSDEGRQGDREMACEQGIVIIICPFYHPVACKIQSFIPSLAGEHLASLLCLVESKG